MTWDRTRETVLAVKDVGCSGNYRPSRFANYFLSGSIKNAAYYIVQGPQAILQALQSLGVPLCLSFGIYFSSFGLSGFRKFKAAVTKSGTRAKRRKPANTLSFKTVWLTAIFKWIGKWIKGEMIYMTRCSSGFFFFLKKTLNSYWLVFLSMGLISSSDFATVYSIKLWCSYSCLVLPPTNFSTLCLGLTSSQFTTLLWNRKSVAYFVFFGE